MNETVITVDADGNRKIVVKDSFITEDSTDLHAVIPVNDEMHLHRKGVTNSPTARKR